MSSQPRVVFHHGTNLVHAPTTIAAFVQKMTVGITPKTIENDQRSDPRYTLSTIVDAQAVDGEYHPIDEVFRAVTRDISLGGIGLSHNRAIDSEYLAIQLTNAEGDQLQTVVKVLRNRPHDNTYDIGAKFITSK